MKQEKQQIQMPTKAELLNIALTQKGELSKSFNLFRRFSVNNVIWLHHQMKSKNIPITPVKTFKQWQALNRKVKKGSEGLYMQEIRIWTDKNDLDKNGEPKEKRYFPITKNHFAMSQTTGEDNSEKIFEYYNLNVENVLKNLNIKKVDFNIMNGNAQGYSATGKNEIAINPLDKEPLQTFTHEVAHAILHKDNKIQHELAECEAEATSFIVCSLIDDKMDLSSSRAYIQRYMKKAKITELPKENSERIFTAVDIILSASDNDKNKMKRGLEKLNV